MSYAESLYWKLLTIYLAMGVGLACAKCVAALFSGWSPGCC